MKEYFRLYEKPMIIYGAASIGFTVYKICRELNISVEGFIDKRGEEISELEGIKVYSFESDEIDKMDKDVSVFIAVKDVFEHENIANQLVVKGFHNLIYRPYATLKGKGSNEEKILYAVYDDFMENKLINVDIPCTSGICKYEYKDCATIHRRDKYRVVYIPIERLFTDMDGRIDNNRWMQTWRNIPTLALVPHIAFFKWMDRRNDGSYDMYLDFCMRAAEAMGSIKITEAWKENVIKNRANVYYNMNESLERDSDFFIRNAPEARWNNDGHFNLVSGKHRATFYIAKGKRFIPCKISEEDFGAWINDEKIRNITKRFNELNIKKINAPIGHPYFYDFYCENGNLYYNILRDFIYGIAMKQYSETGSVRLNELSTVFLSLNDDGYMSRVMSEFGISVEVHNRSAASRILEELICYKKEVIIQSKYDYALIEYKWGDEVDFADILLRNIKNMISLVPVKEMEEFEDIIADHYFISERRETMKDGTRFIIYNMETKNTVWQRNDTERNFGSG